MKRCLLMFLLVAFCISGNAQFDNEIVIKASNKITKQSTPRQVIDSLKKRFPNAQAVQYYKTPASAVRAGWVVEEEDNTNSDDELDSYTISFKRNDFKYYALFDASGKLLMSRFEEYGSKLPTAVKESLKKVLGSDYADYTLVSKNHYRKVNHDKRKEYYQIDLVNKKDKKDKKTITLAPDGKLLKERG